MGPVHWNGKELPKFLPDLIDECIYLGPWLTSFRFGVDTGDRPYMCVLCKDTFSRSDILKRHFQKCSLRRGNPTGVSHLSHPQAHVKRSQVVPNAVKPVQDEVSSSIPPSTGLVGTTFGEGSVNSNGLASGRPGFTEQQPLGYSMSSVNGMSRSQPDSAIPPGQAHQRASWMAAPKQNPYLVQPGSYAPNQLNNIDRPPVEQAKPPIAHDAKRPVMPGQQPNHSGELDWAAMFQPQPSEGYMFPQSMPPSHEPIHSQVEPERKFYPTTTGAHQEGGGMNGLYMASTTMGGDGMYHKSISGNEKKICQEKQMVDEDKTNPFSS
jgi:hypothetical protein